MPSYALRSKENKPLLISNYTNLKTHGQLTFLYFTLYRFLPVIYIPISEFYDKKFVIL